MRSRIATTVLFAIFVVVVGGRADAQCTGDCSGDNVVQTGEVVTCVGVGLGTRPLGDCERCSLDDDVVQVTDLVDAVANLMDQERCPPLPTATDTPTMTPTAQDTPTVTPTPTGTQVCPLEEGEYTLTQTSGGTLTVSTIPPFPFPAGGTIVLDVAEAQFPQCTHEVNIKSPGGFFAPVFCIPGLAFSVNVAQRGCGIGEIDSNGGADYTVTEIGDTSDSSSVCNLPQTCSAAQDSAARLDVTVGDGETDQCSGGGSANMLVSVPVFTTTWLRLGTCNICPSTDPNCCPNGDPRCCPFTEDGSMDGCCNCPDVDDTYNPGTDTLIVSFPQTLDFTTDTTSADFADLDGDGCCIAGAGPASVTIPCNPAEEPIVNGGAGTCLDLEQNVVTSAAAGAIGSAGGPLYDLTFATVLPNDFSRSGDFGSVVCEEPPVLPIGELAGTTASRCISE